MAAKEPKLADLRSRYRQLWESAALNPKWDKWVKHYTNMIWTNRKRYEAVAARTGVPWYLIAVKHMREASCRFDGVLHNGDKIIGTGRKTYRVPAGRGPFNTWEDAAVDALKLKGLHKIKDWSLEQILYQCERFNGWGYHWKRRISPYVWSGTQHYVKGKYVADHEYDGGHVDTQLGTAVVLRRLEQRGVVIDPRPIKVPPPPPDIEPVEPEPDIPDSPKAEDHGTKPAAKSKTIWASIGGILASIAAFATDWRVLTVLVVAFFAFIIAERYFKLDIKGWFRS